MLTDVPTVTQSPRTGTHVHQALKVTVDINAVMAENSVLKGENGTLKSEVGALKDENSSLRDELASAKALIAQLQR
jgi:cell division protein FtsB